MAYFHTNVLDNQIKAMPTISTTSGSVASFDTDMTENLIEVVCDIQYQQASGTPTPISPIPIGVYDSLTLYHNDINLWDEDWELGYYSNSTGQPVPSTTNIRCKHYISVKPSTAYYIVSPTQLGIIWYDINHNYISQEYARDSVKTSPNNAYYLRVYAGSAYGTTYNNDISINYPSTDTEYHAFNGAYIPFGQTVAKGTLNVTTGVLEITHGYKVFDGSETFTTASNNRYFYTAPSDIIIPTESLADYVTSSHFVGSTQGQQADKSVWKTTGNRIVVFRDSSIADLTAWYNFLTTQYNNGTPVQLIYELATPLTIQLSATQITALLNENNIWCDTNGDTEVKYILSVGKAIS